MRFFTFRSKKTNSETNSCDWLSCGLLIGCCVAALMLAGGCGSESASDPQGSADTPAVTVSNVPLRILLPDGERLSAAIQTAWQGVSEQPIELITVSETEFAAHADKADVILLPARLTGDAVAERWIVPLPESWLKETGGIADFLPALQDQQMRFGTTYYGLSLGSPLAVIGTDAGHADSLQEKSTADDRLAALNQLQREQSAAIAQPLSADSAVYAFLVRSAGRVTDNWLFDRNTMRCQLANDPVYAAALQELIDLHQSLQSRPTGAEVLEMIERGDAIAAIHQGPIDRDDWICLPLATDENANSISPFVMEGSGLLASLASACRQSGQARTFMRWVSERETVKLLANASPRITLTQASSASSSPYEAALVDSLSRYRGFRPTLRLRGAVRYYQHLATAIDEALEGSLTAEEALKQASLAWDELTDELGDVEQRNSWLQSQGLPALR